MLVSRYKFIDKLYKITVPELKKNKRKKLTNEILMKKN